MNRALLSSKKMDYATPWALYEMLDRQFSFTVDACAVRSNTKHPRFWSPKENGLAQSWEGETVFCNPPYGEQLPWWVSRAKQAAAMERAIACLVLPARVGTSWWREHVMQASMPPESLIQSRSRYEPHSQVHWYRWPSLIVGVHIYPERVLFDGMEDGAPFDTALVVMASPNRKPPKPKAIELGDVDFRRGWP